jgi:putative ABC transport system permease protein
MRPVPPRLARRLLEALLRPGVRSDSVRGDLVEEFGIRAGTSLRAARRWYWRQAIAVALRTAVSGDPERQALSGQRAGLAGSLWQDVRASTRALAKARGFTTASILTLALGIGAATAVFSVLEAVLVRPLAFVDPARVMWMTEVFSTDGSTMSIAWPDYLDWRTRLTSFERLGAVQPTTLNLTGLDVPERLTGRYVTAGFLDTLGVQPAIGRSFAETDDRVGAAPVAIISDGFWRTHFLGDPAVLGRQIDLNGIPTAIVGVLPRGFRYNPLANDAVYLPLGAAATESSGMPDRGNHNNVSAVGRLRPGATEGSARTELATLTAALQREHPDTNANVVGQLMPVTERLVNGVGPVIATLFGAVGILLLLAAVNVASLAVARSISRRQELAIRAALGCGRRRLLQYLVTENLLIAVAGGAAGVAVAAGLIRALIAAAPPSIPRLDEVRIDVGVIVFALAISIGIALVIAIFPGVVASGARDQTSLVRSSRGDVGSASGQRVRRGLMVVEIALAVILLTGAGLMARTLHALLTVDPGFDLTHVLTLRFSIDGDQSSEEAGRRFGEKLVAFYDRLIPAMRAVPGVVDAGAAQSLPIDGAQWNSVFTVEGLPVPARALLPSAAFVPSTPGVFSTLGIRLQTGRFFRDADSPSAAKVAIVNEEFVREFLRGLPPIGQHFKQGWPETVGPWVEIVGVVNDVKLNGLEAQTPAQIYLPMAQRPASSPALVLRTAGDPAASLSAVRAVFHQLDPKLPLFNVNTMDELVSVDLARQRLTMLILMGFAALALILACVGLFGVVSHGVSARRREIGVRIALGASARQVVGLFVGQGLVTSGAGLTLGIGAGLALGRLVEAQGLLFHVGARDPLTFAVAALLLLGVSVTACYLPARRASRVDPTVTLRAD